MLSPARSFIVNTTPTLIKEGTRISLPTFHFSILHLAPSICLKANCRSFSALSIITSPITGWGSCATHSSDKSRRPETGITARDRNSGALMTVTGDTGGTEGRPRSAPDPYVINQIAAEVRVASPRTLHSNSEAGQGRAVLRGPLFPSPSTRPDPAGSGLGSV